MHKISLILCIVLSTLFIPLHKSSANNLILNNSNNNTWDPIEYYFNGAFDVLQNPNWFSQGEFIENHRTVFRRIRSPNKSIRKDGGYSRFISDEFFSTRVLPNIFLHTLGSSYDTRWLNEYFESRELAHPRLFSFLLTYAAHIGNEGLESTHDEITSHDHIADLYVFDLLGFLLSANDTFMNFLIQDLGFESWHSLPMWDFHHSKFFNAGLNYIIRPSIFKGRIRPIIFMGMQNMGGVSYRADEKHTFSLLGGIAFTDPLREEGTFVTGLFYEQNSQLAASLYINGSENLRWRLNIFPSYLKRNKFPVQSSLKLGFLIGQDRVNSLLLGFKVELPLGFGVKIH